MKYHTFNISIAQKYGVNCAVFIGLLVEQTGDHAHADMIVHFRDNRYWWEISLLDLVNYFPFFSKHQFETAINKSIKNGLVSKEKFKRSEGDQTNSYALTDKGRQELSLKK